MKLLPIYRMGWREARKILESGGRLAKFADGHAEIIGPTKTVERWQGIYGTVKESTGGCCEGYLTARSVELLERHTANAKAEGRQLPTERQV